jgi:hypothetical protein
MHHEPLFLSFHGSKSKVGLASTTLLIAPAGEDEPQYSFSPFEEEDMIVPRVGGDSLLLPNGDILITSGAQT